MFRQSLEAIVKKLLFITIFMSLLCAEAKGADWKFYGFEPAPLFAIVYYDNESIEHLANGNIRVWIKTITVALIEELTEKQQIKIATEAGEKRASGYLPPYCTLETLSNEVIFSIISWEVVTKYKYESYLKMFSEIDCKEKKCALFQARFAERTAK
jgi:hypothetical protein